MGDALDGVAWTEFGPLRRFRRVKLIRLACHVSVELETKKKKKKKNPLPC